MAKPDTPGKRFNEFASQNYWGAESARKTITTVLYKGPYINIERGVERQVQKFIENSADEEFNIDGVVIEDSIKYYVLHDRVRTSNVLTRLGSVKGTAKDTSDDEYTQFKIGGLEFLKDSVGPDIVKKVRSVYDKISPQKISEHTLAKIMQGIYAFQNSYRVNDDVLFGHTVGKLKTNDLQGWSFVLNVPTARSKVAGRHDHVEFVKAKYMDSGIDSTSFVISGKSKEVLKASELINSKNSALSSLKVSLPVSYRNLEKSKVSDSVEFRKLQDE